MTIRDTVPHLPPRARRFPTTRLVPIAILLVALGLFFGFGLQRYVSFETLKANRAVLTDWVATNGLGAALAYGAIYALAVACSLPGGALLTIAGGFLFGPLLATVATVIGATLGATALYLAARYAFADYLRARAGAALRRMEAGFNEDALSYLLVLRLVPLFPFWLVNLVPALLGVRLSTYVLGTFIGIIPGTFVFALVGDGLGAVLDAGGNLDLGFIFEPRFLAPLLGLAVLALVPAAYKRLKARKR